MSSNVISFTINGKSYTVDPTVVPPISLNLYLREYAGLKGTKFMCLEGGCGVCIVTIKFKQTFAPNKECAVNSCLYPLYACQNTDITTIEGLGNHLTGYGTEQVTLANYHGSQCGYCSPGMIMNMHGLMQSKPSSLTKVEIENSFGGNICRCTGYRSILDAFKSMVSTVDVDSSYKSDIEDMPKKCPKSGLTCAGTCKPEKIKILSAGNLEWHKVFTIADIFAILNSIAARPYMFISGNTAHGVYRRDPNIEVFIDVTSVAELHSSNIGANIQIGANNSLNDTISILKAAALSNSNFVYCNVIADHIDKIANVPVRNTGTIAGNLTIKYQHNEFPSDMFLLLETVGAQLTIVRSDSTTVTVSPQGFPALDMNKRLITLITLPSLPSANYSLRTYKIMPRAQNAHAFVNAGFLYQFNSDKTSILSATICYGGINPTFIHATNTENYLIGLNLFTNTVIQGALNTLDTEISPDWVLPDTSPEFRKDLAFGLIYKSVLSLCPSSLVAAKYLSGGTTLVRPLSSGIQTYDTYPSLYPVTQTLNKLEAGIQCSGEAVYVNDMPKQPNELWAAFVLADKVGGLISGFDTTVALAIPGVLRFLKASDIPRENSFTPPGMLLILSEEKIFCSDFVLYNGQPAGMILADTFETAHLAASKVVVQYATVSEIKTKPNLFTLKDVLKSDQTERIARVPRTVRKDPIKHEINLDEAIEVHKEISNDKIGLIYQITDSLELGSQYHFTMETQSCFCIPTDDGLQAYSSTQWMDLVQTAISLSLDIPLNKLAMQVARLGGAYGSKISRASQIACACALGAYITNRPVRFQMQLEQNMRAIGKRTSCYSNYDVTFDAFGKIILLTNTFYEDTGCSYNEPVVIFTLDAFINCYNPIGFTQIPNIVLTDAASNTWIRAPGSAEGVCMIENIMEHIAKVTGQSPYAVRLANILTTDPMYKMLTDFVVSCDFDNRKAAIDTFNAANRWRKRGIGMSVINYGLIFFATMPVIVQVYSDGTVSITHGGIEMGQGINTKAAQVAAKTLGIPLSLISIIPTNSSTTPNASMSGGSVAGDSVCYAVIKACEQINGTMLPIKITLLNPIWKVLVKACYTAGLNMSGKYTYQPTDSAGKAYSVYGCSCAEVEVDLLTGNFIFTRVDILEDVGKSLSPSIDIGQIEGAFMMGVGYYTCENLVYDRITGRLLTDRTWTYKPPGAKDIPVDFRVTFLKNSVNNVGIFGSKATGEPAFTLACCVLFALRHALTSARKDAGLNDDWFRLGAPTTVETISNTAGINTAQFQI